MCFAKRTLLFTTISASLSGMANAAPLTVEVTQGVELLPTEQSFSPVDIALQPASDITMLLDKTQGISGIRMGGRALDPVIRGQRETQLNVLLDGAYLQGGCPNRMDPPTTYASSDSYDKITLIKGSQTVRYGAGGTGGTILLSRERPVLNDDGYRLDLTGSARNNAGGGMLSADAAVGNDQGYLRLVASHDEANNYEDGAGNEVRSAYETRSGAVILGLNLSDSTELQLSYDRNEERNVLFAGAGMDSPSSDADSYRARIRHTLNQGPFQLLTAELYQSNVDHLMDSYSLRGLPAGMVAPSTSDTSGGRVFLEGWLGAHEVVVGADIQTNERDATLYNYPAGMPMGILWPDVTLQQVGIFAEVARQLDSSNRLKTGLRLDHITAEADRLTESFMMGSRTPVMLYGATPSDQSEHNLSGFVSWQHQLSPDAQIETTLSRGVRTADATERYMAKSNWVGNPWLNPEKHHQLEVTYRQLGGEPWSISAFYNQVDDYILRYQDVGVERYKNVEAALYGLEASYQRVLTPTWTLFADATYTVGENLDDDQPLSRISPLSATLRTEYKQGPWQGGVRWLLSAAQNDVCLNSSSCAGQDVAATAGFGVVDLYMKREVNQSVALSMGVDNLFDKLYRHHESRDNVFDPSPIQVNEPGRTVWLSVSGHF